MDKAASFFGYAVLFLLSALASMPTTGSTEGASNKAVVFRLSANDKIDIRYEGKWGKICAVNSYKKPAASICKQMGYMDTGYKPGRIDTALTDIAVDNVTCTGTAIDSCTFTPSNSNSKCHAEPDENPLVLRITCKAQTNVRLIKTESNAHSGIFEISRGTQRGVVCADSGKMAKVVCTQMGYSDGANEHAVKKPADYKGKVFDVACSTKSLDDCTITEKASCNQVQRVQCQVNSASQTTFNINLSKSSKQTNEPEGTVEIYKYGKWGVICDTVWDKKDADVVCRELGFKNSLATTGFPNEAYYGQGTGVVFWNNVKCTGDEPSIVECTHDVVWGGTGTCNSVNAAGVRCSGDKFPTFDFCSDVNITVPKGVSFLESPAYPADTFSYQSGTTCSCSPTVDPKSSSTLSAYVNQKRFTGNKVEYLTLVNGSVTHELYGENTTAGPFESSVQNFTIEFRSNGMNGKGKLRIQLKASESVNLTCTKTVHVPSTPKPTSTPPPRNEAITVTESSGTIAGIVVGVIIAIVAIAVILIVLYKKKKICQGSIGSLDMPSNTENGGMDNDVFDNKDEGMKDNDLYHQSSSAVTGNGNFSQNNSEYAEVVKPKNKRNLEVTEPETGEKKANGGVLRPASGSAVKVNFPNRAYNANEYELEEPVKGVEESAPNDLKPQPDGAVYAVVNKPRSLKAAKGNQGTKPVGTEPTNPNQDGNNPAKPATDTRTPFTGGHGLYAEVGSNNRTPQSLPPINKGYTPSSAYADVDIIGDKPEIDEKKEEKSPKKSTKKKTKEKKKKKDGKSGKDAPSSDRRPTQEQTSCAVPIFDDGTYAEVGQKDPVGGNQSSAADEAYDKLSFQGRGKPVAQTGDDTTYDVVQRP